MKNLSVASKSSGTAVPVDISVIIPCFNEAATLTGLLRVLASSAHDYAGRVEIIVVDGGSNDDTLAVAKSYARQASAERFSALRLLSAPTSRAKQMNVGAAAANGGVLYFVHADTRPPLSCLRDVASAALRFDIGGYAFCFDSQRSILRFNSYLTRFNTLSVRGGDQSIFIKRSVFRTLGGYAESMAIMEEYDLIRRACEGGHRYHLLQGATLVSDRKYHNRSWVRVQVANIVAVAGWRLGSDTLEIRDRYARMLGPTKQS